MVKKLFKHEFLAYMRVILPMHLILLVGALANRIVQLFETDNSLYKIVFGSSAFIFGAGIMVCLVLTSLFGIKRFYSHLFTHEGYLTLTLPVTPTQHIFVKLIVATTSLLFSIVMIFASLCVITFGDVCSEIFKAIGFIYNLFYDIAGADLVFYIIELIVLFIVSIMTAYLLYYACISIGQRAKKNRVLAAIGVYFIYYAITQILSTILMVLLPIFAENLPLDKIAEFAAEHPGTIIHIVLCGSIVLTAIMGFIYFIISKHTISKKLNLE